MRDMRVWSLGLEDPRVRKISGSGRSPGVGSGNPLKNPCHGKISGQRSLAGYSPSGCFNHCPDKKWGVFTPLLKVHMTSSSVNKQNIWGNHCKVCFHARTGVGKPQLRSVKPGLQLICVSKVLMKWSHTHSLASCCFHITRARLSTWDWDITALTGKSVFSGFSSVPAETQPPELEKLTSHKDRMLSFVSWKHL